MAELLTYAQSVTSITGGRGDYSMHFLRYEEVPTHVAQKVIEETRKVREAAHAWRAAVAAASGLAILERVERDRERDDEPAVDLARSGASSKTYRSRSLPNTRW